MIQSKARNADYILIARRAIPHPLNPLNPLNLLNLYNLFFILYIRLTRVRMATKAVMVMDQAMPMCM